jgi:hypothetical protein
MTVGLKSPYLLNVILATSALNVSIKKKPEKKDFYRDRAIQLQNHALNNLNNLSPQFTQKTYVPIFHFASSLGMYLLCDTLVSRAATFEELINRFVQFLQIHQAIRMIMDEGRWDHLRDSKFKPLLTLSEWLPPKNQDRGDSDFGPVYKKII